jgi:decaprenylphospho-beta-D-ribofuranose 2-oxidase
MTRVALAGWGRTAPSMAEVLTPTREDELAELLATRPALIARGLGRSYGDAAQLGGGVVIDNRGFADVGPISPAGVVTAGAGVSIDQLLEASLPRGWFVPVTPGTRQVSLGGAVASDVHGKNHHRDGSFAAHVLSMHLVTPTGARTVSRREDPDLFWATMGGMGLTGVVTALTLQLLAVSSDRVRVDTDRFDDLDAVMAAMADGDDAYRYSVAWVDCMTRGSHMGRAILTRGDHADAADLDPGAATLAAPRPARLAVPLTAPPGLLNPLSIRLFNEAWFRSAPRQRRGELATLSSFFHPLDGVRDWNRLYGPHGFVQYQFCVPATEGQCVVDAITRLSSSRLPSFLAVLKRFGPGDPGPLSFPMSGWTLALDLPVGPPTLGSVLDELDELVVAAGGRVYLAKDARLAPERLAAMYPRLDDFAAVRARVDPEGRLTSDLARRLNLGGR